MAAFLAERYWPGVTPVHAAEATDRLRAAGATVAETLVTTDDEVCFWTLEAASTAQVAAWFAAAHVPVNRIASATALPG